MAYLRKIKNTWQLQFYLDGKKRYKHYSPSTPKSILLAEKKRIESEIALHKAGVKRFHFDEESVEFITLRDLTEKVLDMRQNEVAEVTLKRYELAMRNFMKIAGPEMLISNLRADHFQQFRTARYEYTVNRYKRMKWEFNDDKIKRGINTDLVNIRAVLRGAANKGIVQESQVPKIEFYKVDRQRLPNFFSDEEIIAVANELENEVLIAFWILRYTGARRSEVVRRRLKDNDRGLKWKHIDWMRQKVRLYSKKKERFVTLHPALRKILLDRKTELGDSWHPDDHIVQLIGDTLTTYFKRAMEKAGIDKPGAVHILRHTAITKVLSASRNIRVAQEFAGHSQITTTEIYTHVLQEEMDQAVKQAF